MKFEISIVFIIIGCFTCGTWGDLKTFGAKCGSKICKSHEYCSAFDNKCYPCLDICNEGHHNYDGALCMRDCQDYLHDIRYVRKDSGEENEDLRDVVQRLQLMVTVSLTLTCIVIVVLIAMISIQIYRWKNNNNVTISGLCNKFRSKKSNSNKTVGNGVTVGQITGKPELRLDMPTTGSQSEMSPATVTTNISRRPAEDSALDYAYDNLAMSNTPSPHSKAHESNF